jgi:hypothetical protein
MNMNTNSSSMSGLLDRVVDAHGRLERWREVQYLDVQLSVSGACIRSRVIQICVYLASCHQ